MELELIVSRFNENIFEIVDFLMKEVMGFSQRNKEKSIAAAEHTKVQIFVYNKDANDPENESLIRTLKQSLKDHVQLISKTVADSSMYCNVQGVEWNLAIHSLKNVGRESHTYLHHIVTHYELLASNPQPKVLVFLPGSCTNPRKITLSRRILKYAMETKNSAFVGQYFEKTIDRQFSNFTMKGWEGTTAENAAQLPSHLCFPSSFRPFGKWFSHFFFSSSSSSSPSFSSLPEEEEEEKEKESLPMIHVSCYTGVFAVSSRHITQNRSQLFYRELLEEVVVHSNPEAGHFLERSWLAVFHPIPEECVFAAKPILRKRGIIEEENKEKKKKSNGGALNIRDLMKDYQQQRKELKKPQAEEEEEEEGKEGDQQQTKKES
jgi:hypothetical protein